VYERKREREREEEREREMAIKLTNLPERKSGGTDDSSATRQTSQDFIRKTSSQMQRTNANRMSNNIIIEY
jgi:hypothetical protein